MRYLIDSANDRQILDALSLGACGVTANPSMYLKNQAAQAPDFSEHALAVLRLQGKGLSVSEIAASLGFSQDIYFYRLFKHFTQVTPSEYRSSAQWQNGEAEQRMPETRYGGTLSMDRRQTPIKADPATIP